MEIESLFGLPAHPLVVHAAVVLLPMAAIGGVLVAAVARWRRPYAALVLVVALGATAAVWLAQQSGESLEERVDESELVEEHAELAEQLLPWAAAVAVAAAAVVAVDRLKGQRPLLASTKATALLVAVTLVTGVGATWTVAEVGHSGAKATWDDLPEEGD
jgi:hypothetical protein